jgi:hypothetical protein
VTGRCGIPVTRFQVVPSQEYIPSGDKLVLRR